MNTKTVGWLLAGIATVMGLLYALLATRSGPLDGFASACFFVAAFIAAPPSAAWLQARYSSYLNPEVRLTLVFVLVACGLVASYLAGKPA